MIKMIKMMTGRDSGVDREGRSMALGRYQVNLKKIIRVARNF